MKSAFIVFGSLLVAMLTVSIMWLYWNTANSPAPKASPLNSSTLSQGNSSVPLANTPAAKTGMELLVMRVVDAASGKAIENANIEIVEQPQLAKKPSKEGEAIFALPYSYTTEDASPDSSRDYAPCKIRVTASDYKSLAIELNDFRSKATATYALPNLVANMQPNSNDKKDSVMTTEPDHPSLTTQPSNNPSTEPNAFSDPFSR